MYQVGEKRINCDQCFSVVPKMSKEVTLVNNNLAVGLWDIMHFLKYQTSFWKHIATQFFFFF